MLENLKINFGNEKMIFEFSNFENVFENDKIFLKFSKYPTFNKVNDKAQQGNIVYHALACKNEGFRRQKNRKGEGRSRICDMVVTENKNLSGGTNFNP